MKELKCQNCNSNDIEFKDGIWVCSHCGSKYVPDKNEKPQVSEEDKLIKKMIKLFEKRDKHDDIDKRMYYYGEISDCIQDILRINPKSAYAYAGKYLLDCANTYKTLEEAEKNMGYVEKALTYAVDEEERKCMTKSMSEHFWFHKSSVLERFPELKDKIEQLQSMMMQG